MAASINTHKKFIFHFANEYTDFRMTELKSIIKVFSAIPLLNKVVHEQKNPFFVVDLPPEAASQIMDRTFLVRSLFEYWAEGHTKEELYDNLRKLSKDFIAPFLKHDKTFRVKIEAYNKTLTPDQKLEKIQSLPQDALDFQGKANLKWPDNSFHLFEYYGPAGSTPYEEPSVIYFGRFLKDGQRDKIQQYHLQKRHFIGNTSMDAGLSLIMANMGKVKHGDLVYDPFVGSGSLLVACAHFGAYVAGSDIDYTIVHGVGKSSRHKNKKRSSDESIHTNLKQYNLQHHYIDILLADSSKHNMLRTGVQFDAIITDPPYGIREPSKKIAGTRDKNNTLDVKTNYSLSESFLDLLNFAAKFLKLGGCLVYWLPIYRPDYTEDNIPQHPSLKLVGNCEQTLTTLIARRLIVMEKCSTCQGDVGEKGAIVVEDHYKNNFRDRYFQVGLPQTQYNGEEQINSKDTEDDT